MEVVKFGLLCVSISVQYMEAAPPTQRPMAGPCVGMDCMHGVLMHGDSKSGDGHQHEDKLKQEAEEAAIKKKEASGPKDAMESLHGVMMHGDSDLGDDHQHEDKMKLKQEAAEAAMKKKEPSGPKDAMDSLHGVLMHADEKSDVAHMHQKAGPEQVKGKAGPGDGMDMLHGVMMHGDNKLGRSHEEEHRELTKPPIKRDGSKPDGPCVGMDCLHGVLMHGDADAGSDHTQEHAHDKEKLVEKAGRKFSAPDPESAMHGAGGDHDHVHSPDNKAPISEKHKGIPSISDPHEAIHGDLRGQIKSAGTKNKDDADYAEWLKAEKNKDKKKDEGYLGFSFPFISDSLLDNIEILKRRYMPKFWGGVDAKAEKAEVEEKKEKAEEEIVHELLSDLEMIGDTGPRKEHPHQKPTRGDREGSGTKRDEV